MSRRANVRGKRCPRHDAHPAPQPRQDTPSAETCCAKPCSGTGPGNRFDPARHGPRPTLRSRRRQASGMTWARDNGASCATVGRVVKMNRQILPDLGVDFGHHLQRLGRGCRIGHRAGTLCEKRPRAASMNPAQITVRKSVTPMEARPPSVVMAMPCRSIRASVRDRMPVQSACASTPKRAGSVSAGRSGWPRAPGPTR